MGLNQLADRVMMTAALIAGGAVLVAALLAAGLP